MTRTADDTWGRATLTLPPASVQTTTPSTTAHIPSAVEPCPECQGVGFFGAAVPFGHPQFGTLLPCRCTLARRAAVQAVALEHLSNLQVCGPHTFATFNPDVPGVRKAYLRAQDFAQAPQGWLLLFGGYGVGKTHLAAAAARVVLDRGEPVLFTVVPDLLDHLRATFGPNSEVGYDERFELIRSARLLVLDDLGTESATGWAREKLYQIVNHRYNAQLPTIITSNRALDNLDGRIVSRMCQRAFRSEILHIAASDYRRHDVTGGPR